MRILVSVKQIRNVYQTLLSMSFREELKILWFCYMADRLLKLSPVLLAQCHLLILLLHAHILPVLKSWASLLWLRGGLGDKSFSTNKRQGRESAPERTYRVLLGYRTETQPWLLGGPGALQQAAGQTWWVGGWLVSLFLGKCRSHRLGWGSGEGAWAVHWRGAPERYRVRCSKLGKTKMFVFSGTQWYYVCI